MEHIGLSNTSPNQYQLFDLKKNIYTVYNTPFAFYQPSATWLHNKCFYKYNSVNDKNRPEFVFDYFF